MYVRERSISEFFGFFLEFLNRSFNLLLSPEPSYFFFHILNTHIHTHTQLLYENDEANFGNHGTDGQFISCVHNRIKTKKAHISSELSQSEMPLDNVSGLFFLSRQKFRCSRLPPPPHPFPTSAHPEKPPVTKTSRPLSEQNRGGRRLDLQEKMGNRKGEAIFKIKKKILPSEINYNFTWV